MQILRLPRVWLRFGLGLGTAALLLAAGGCASRGSGPDRAPPQPLLFSQAAFFDGAVAAEALLGPFRLDDPVMPFDRTPPQPGEGEPVPVTGGTFGGRAQPEVGTGFPRGPAEEGAFGSGPAGRREARPGRGPGPAGPVPRQSLNLRLLSRADEPVTLRVVEVKSALGNFVPVPETLTLQPGATQELEPMRSAYPGSIDELELLVTLRIRGREETQVLKLTPAAPPAPNAP